MKSTAYKGMLIGILGLSLLFTCACQSESSQAETEITTTIASETIDVGIADFTLSEVLDSALRNGKAFGFDFPCAFSELPATINIGEPTGKPLQNDDVEGYVTSLCPFYENTDNKTESLTVLHREEDEYTTGTVVGFTSSAEGISFSSNKISFVMGETDFSEIKAVFGTSGLVEKSTLHQYQCSDGNITFFTNTDGIMSRFIFYTEE